MCFNTMDSTKLTTHEQHVTIYTDGACSPNPGTGGWAAILIYENGGVIHDKELSGGESNTTNNRMEIMAVLAGLQALKQPCHVVLYSDSKYVVDSVGWWECGIPSRTKCGWMVKWHADNWSKKDGRLKNVDLWQLLYMEIQRHKSIKLKWVKGHDTDERNIRCDTLAVEARTRHMRQ